MSIIKMSKDICDLKILKASNRCIGKTQKLESLNWACPVMVCSISIQHTHNFCTDCYKYAKDQTEILKKRYLNIN